MNRFNFIYLPIVLLGIVSCTPKKNTENGKETSAEIYKTIELVAQEWPGQEPKSFKMPVYSGLDRLEFGTPEKVPLDESDLVIGLALDDSHIALPLLYLEGFEVANLSINEENYLVTWCGLVGSAQVFKGNFSGDTLGFDFGRALMDNNLLMVDRKTKSVWNQLSKKAIHGKLKGAKLELLPTSQTTWGYWVKKHPDTKVLFNKDTTGAAFPSLLFENPRYTTWEPGSEKFYTAADHQPENLGLGLEMEGSAIYFPFETLFKKTSPIEYKILGETLVIHFDESGMTAWVEDSKGNLLPSTLAYNWAWKNFHSETLIFEN